MPKLATLIACTLIIATAAPAILAQERVSYRIVRKATLQINEGIDSIQIKEPLPRKDFEDVSVSGLLCSPNYNALIKDPDGNTIAIFYFSQPFSGPSLTILTRYTVELKQKPCPTDASQVGTFTAEELSGKQAYLGDQGDIRITDSIRQASRSIVAGQTNPYLKAKSIYDYIVDTIRYKDVEGFSGVQTSYEILESKRGTCGDITKLFVALTRAAGVPARPVAGYAFEPNVSPTKDSGDKGHAWAEIYLPGYGWQAVDPTFGIGTKGTVNYFCFTNTTHIKECYGQLYSRMVGSLYSGSEILAYGTPNSNAAPPKHSILFEIERLPNK